MEKSKLDTAGTYNYQQINATLDEIRNLFEQDHELDPEFEHMPDRGYYTTLLKKVVFDRPAQAKEMLKLIRRSFMTSSKVEYLDILSAYRAESKVRYGESHSSLGGLCELNKQFKNQVLVDVSCITINDLYPTIIAKQTKILENRRTSFHRDYSIFSDFKKLVEFFKSYRAGLTLENFALLKAIINGFYGFYINRMPLPDPVTPYRIAVEGQKLVRILASQFKHVIAIDIDQIYCWDISGDGFNRCLDIMESEDEIFYISKDNIPYAFWSGKRKIMFMKTKPKMYGFAKRPIINGEEQVLRGNNGKRIPITNPPLSEWLDS